MYTKNVSLIHKFLCIITIFAIITVSMNNFAYAVSTKGYMSLNDAILLSLKNNNDLKAKAESANAINNAASASISRSLPTLSLNYRKSAISERDIWNGSFGDYGSDTNVGFILSQDLNIYKHINNYRYQTKKYDIANLDTIKSTKKLILETVSAYNALLSSDNKVKLYTENVRTFQERNKMAEKQLELGEISAREMAKSKAKLSKQIYNKVNAESDYKTAYEKFVKITNTKPNKKLKMNDKIPQIINRNSIEDLITAAISNNTDIQIAANSKEATKHSASLEKAGYAGSYSLSFATNNKPSSNTSVTSPYNRDSKAVSLEVRIPFFQSGNLFYTNKKGVSEVAKANYEYKSAIENVVYEISSNYAKLESSVSSIDAMKELIASKELEFKATKKEVMLKIRTFVDELDAQVDLADAKVGLLDSQLQKIYYTYALVLQSGKIEEIIDNYV